MRLRKANHSRISAQLQTHIPTVIEQSRCQFQEDADACNSHAPSFPNFLTIHSNPWSLRAFRAAVVAEHGRPVASTIFHSTCTQQPQQLRDLSFQCRSRTACSFDMVDFIPLVNVDALSGNAGGSEKISTKLGWHIPETSWTCTRGKPLQVCKSFSNACMHRLMAERTPWVKKVQVFGEDEQII